MFYAVDWRFFDRNEVGWPVEKSKKEKLQKNGWIVGDLDEYLGLSPAEVAIVEMKTALGADKKELLETLSGWFVADFKPNSV